MNAENNPLVSLSNAMADAVEKAGAYTVLVDARRRLPATGVAYSSDLVLTADHVVEREEDIHLLLPNGEQADASLAGRDTGNDLVLLRLKDKILTAAEPAPLPARLGQIALAVGRPTPEGLQVSLGVVSSIGGPVRTGRGGLLEQYLRTDAIPYPGFSGGPLIDASARVLGINTSGAARGVSLTIPAGLAWGIANSLAKHGHIRRGFLGVRSQAVELPAAQSLRSAARANYRSPSGRRRREQPGVPGWSHDRRYPGRLGWAADRRSRPAALHPCWRYCRSADAARDPARWSIDYSSG